METTKQTPSGVRNVGRQDARSAKNKQQKQKQQNKPKQQRQQRSNNINSEKDTCPETKIPLCNNDVISVVPCATQGDVENQPTINVGTIGHVTHGKSTLAEALSSIKTAKFDSELERNMTIRLGYANVKIWKCPTCPEPLCYSSSSSKEKSGKVRCSHCLAQVDLARHVSFVDCPGHDVLMATMLNGAAVMDAALLLVAANEPCPQPQTKEHLAAVELMGLRDFAIIQNKVDLVSREKALENYNAIKTFASNTHARSVPVIPISAQRKLNLDLVCQYLANIPIPKRDLPSPPLMTVVRSFDVNKPGTEIDDIVGGVAGGSLTRGVLQVGQTVEIRPGVIFLQNGIKKCRPIRTTIISMSSETNKLLSAIPGGLVGVATTVDPSLTKSDRMVGHMIGIPGEMPEVYEQVEINYAIMKRVVGVDTEHEAEENKELKREEIVKVNIGSATANATVKKVGKNCARITLDIPSCAEVGEKISISRRIRGHWRLIGFGKMTAGSTPMKLEEVIGKRE